MTYLITVAVSFLLIHVITFIQLKKEGKEKNLFTKFNFFFILYLSLIPFVNLIIAFLFLLVPIMDKYDNDREIN